MARRRPFALWAFSDESGNPGDPGDPYVVIATVATTRPEELGRVALAARRARNLSPHHVLHATGDPETAETLLANLGELQEARLTVIALDRRYHWRHLSPSTLYRALAAYALGYSLSRFPDLSARALVVIEARTPRRSWPTLRAHLADGLGLNPEQVMIERKDSPDWGDHLQTADAVAWAYYQSLARDDPRYAALVAHLADLELVGIDAQGLIRPVETMRGDP